MTKVYVSATFSDLKECREAVVAALLRLRVTVVAMEHYNASDPRPLDTCLADVDECDIYVGIFAWRYGFVPTGQDRSITELEYRRAVEQGKQCLIFLLDETAAWPMIHIDRDRGLDQVEALRAELMERHTFNFFANSAELALKVATAVASASTDQGALDARGRIGPDLIARYYDLLRTRYGRLDLEALTPPQREQHLQIQLASVFVEPNVREDSPPSELPREVWQRLRAEGDLVATDLPDGLDAAELTSLYESYRAKPLRRVLDVAASPEHRLLVMLGDPGSGKSTAARYLLLALAQAHPGPRLDALAGHIPLLIELRSFAIHSAEGRAETFLEYLDYRARTAGLGFEQSVLEPYLAHGGPALLVVDGLDEIFDPYKREEAAGQIAAFAARYPQVRVMVTSRIVGYSRGVLADAGFSHITLQDLDERQVGEFLESWYALALHDRPDDAKDRRRRLLEAVRALPAIKELAGNPLLLTILAIIGMNQALPGQRWQLYEHAAGVLVEHWEVKKNVASRMDQYDKFELLRRLAFKMQAGEHGLAGNYIHERDLHQIFTEFLTDRGERDATEASLNATAMINQFRERNFILSLYGANIYGFVHRAFLEFFCASEFVKKYNTRALRPNDLERLVAKQWRDPTWREVLRLIVGNLENPPLQARLIEQLVAASSRPWPVGSLPEPPWNLALAAQCLAEARTPAAVEAVAEALLNQVILVLEHCVSIADKNATDLIEDEIIPALRSAGPSFPSASVFMDWYWRRGVRMEWGPTNALPARLAAILVADSNEFIALLKRGPQRSTNFRAAVSYGAGELLLRASPQVATDQKVLLDVAGSNDPAQVRQAAIRALEPRVDDDVVRALLTERIRVDAHPSVRRAAMAILARRATEPAIRALLLERAQHEKVADVQQAAVNSVAQLVNDPDVLALLVHLAQASGTHPDVRQAAIRALAPQVGDRDVRRMLLDRVRIDPNANVRQVAVRTLGQTVDEPSMRKRLRNWAASDRDPMVRQAAVRALGHRIDISLNRALLVELAADPTPAVRHAAVQTLSSRVYDAEVRDLMFDRAIHDEQSTVRQAAVQALAPRVDDLAVRTLLRDRVRDDPSPEVQLAALRALGPASEDRTVLALLLERAHLERRANVRRAAIQALTQRVDEPAIPALLIDVARSDDDSTVRTVAINALGQRIAEPEIRELMEQLARTDHDLHVRNAAWRVLICLPNFAVPDLPTIPEGETIP